MLYENLTCVQLLVETTNEEVLVEAGQRMSIICLITTSSNI